jgi:hypothetical protein
MPYFHLIDYIPWIGSTIAECIVVGIMLRRGLVRRFPIFFSSIVFDLLREMILPAVDYYSALAYGYGYWLSIPVEDILGFAVMMEACRYSLVDDPKVPAKTLWLLAVAAIALVSLALFFVLHPDIPTSNLSGLVLTLNRSVDLLRCGMLLFLLVFATRLGLGWRHHVWGIVFGLGFYSVTGLIVAAIHATTGIMGSDWLARLPHFGYLAATITWTVYLWRPEPARGPLTVEELSLINHLTDRYRKILVQIRRLFLDGNTY